MVTTADMPARSGCGLPTSFWSSSTFTGTRCTTFTQLPVAFSGGSNEKRAPVPALIDSTMPWKTLPGNPSISTSARIPGRTRASCVSLKFASTNTSCSGTMASSGCPGCTTCPSSTVRLETTPSAGALTSV